MSLTYAFLNSAELREIVWTEVCLKDAMTRIRFRVDFAAGCSLGPGKIELLEGIERTGSLRQAARALG